MFLMASFQNIFPFRFSVSFALFVNSISNVYLFGFLYIDLTFIMIISLLLMTLCIHQFNYSSLWYPLAITNYDTSIEFEYLTNFRGTQSVDSNAHRTCTSNTFVVISGFFIPFTSIIAYYACRKHISRIEWRSKASWRTPVFHPF